MFVCEKWYSLLNLKMIFGDLVKGWAFTNTSYNFLTVIIDICGKTIHSRFQMFLCENVLAY